MGNIKRENIEIQLLLDAIFQKYGYDFRSYSRAHVKRRILRRLAMTDLETVSDMIKEVLYHPDFFDKLLLDLSINVTEMFRDPSFYMTVRKEIIPVLRTYPFLKIWHAGCSTGEEIYSLAILLQEEGLYGRVQIYATDFNEVVLEKAKEGIYPIDFIKDYTVNYQQAGGTRSFSDYYSAHYDYVIMKKALRERVVFADHNLVTDGVFGEMNMIICRNVLIYFNQELQGNVHKLFLESLCPGGFLCLGSKESLRFSKYYDSFTAVLEKEKIYRKKYGDIIAPLKKQPVPETQGPISKI
ncbi:MAG: protein-glutamate O-methyltransferase CheR [Proteobacteria bacterium]|nr:protein-glutamate O-methyltransferase CheR [Pseudomonadota bacterium]MBU1711324.1 protein-glutamate O-methyltransferase CheR [Pseudomonadota bacterium]